MTSTVNKGLLFVFDFGFFDIVLVAIWLSLTSCWSRFGLLCIVLVLPLSTKIRV